LNPEIALLQPYPFEKLRALFAQVTPSSAYKPINLQIGEPKHKTPEIIEQAVAGNLAGLAAYPATAGTPELRESIAAWIEKRHAPVKVAPETEVLPVNGSREALFAFAQVVLDRQAESPVVICPNPFYQIYEGAALLGGASPHFVNMGADRNFVPDYSAVPEQVWRRTQLLYTCSPGNPTGRVMSMDEWRILFELSDRYGFAIASDECYSELYYDESSPPLGGLRASQHLGRREFKNLAVFSSLSKRSNVPGMRSGFVAGDSRLIKAFLLYRTYHGSAMSPVFQAASAAAWRDEEHVGANRKMYAAKYRAVLPLIVPPLATNMPEGGFYLWIRTPISDTEFARQLYGSYNVSVLPGSYLAREANGANPGENHIRVALVAPLDECVEAARRIASFAATL
jgi:N-succinyldiaminopimelate aminotransferase